MNETKFTPGPWSINEWPQATSDIAIGAVGTPLIAKVPLRDVSINEQKANAHLIAASPDLYEALKNTTAHLVAAHSLLQSGGQKAAASNTMFEIMLKDYEKSIEVGRAALSKARGEG